MEKQFIIKTTSGDVETILAVKPTKEEAYAEAERIRNERKYTGLLSVVSGTVDESGKLVGKYNLCDVFF